MGITFVLILTILLLSQTLAKQHENNLRNNQRSQQKHATQDDDNDHHHDENDTAELDPHLVNDNKQLTFGQYTIDQLVDDRSICDSTIQEVFDIFDIDQSGNLSFDEFKKACLYQSGVLRIQPPTEYIIHRGFQYADVDEDGAHSVEEFKSFSHTYIEYLQDPEPIRQALGK